MDFLHAGHKTICVVIKIWVPTFCLLLFEQFLFKFSFYSDNKNIRKVQAFVLHGRSIEKTFFM